MVSKKEKYLVSAQKFIERGQLDKALTEYARVVEEDPKDARTWLKMAELHAKRGANAEASEIYLRTGDLYVEQGFAQKALAVYKNALKLSPGTVAAHLKVGALFNQLGLLSDAVQQFELAATALQRAGKPGDAVAALAQAVDLQPENVILRVKLAESASHAGMIAEAVREFGRAAEQLKAQGRGDEALRVIERLLFHEPENFARAQELAEAYIARGTPRLALPKLQACLNGDPRDPRTLSLLARALEQLGQVPKAVSVLKELVRLCEELGRSSERDAAVLRGLTLAGGDRELLAAAARYQPRTAAAAAAVQATPPPVGAAGAGLVAIGNNSAGSGRVWGQQSSSSAAGSGRVVVPVGAGEESGNRGQSGRHQSVAPGVAADISRVLAEADVFVKYGLLERAADHLNRVFEVEPEHREARERLIVVLQRLGRHEDVARHTERLNAQLATPPPNTPSAADAGSMPPRRATLRSGPVNAPAVLYDALAGLGSGPQQSLGISIDEGDEADDPAADLMTPPPVISATATSSGPIRQSPTLAVDEAAQAAAPLVSDFDAEVRTGDVLITGPEPGADSDIEFSIDDGGYNEVDEDAAPGRRAVTDATLSAGRGDENLQTPRVVRTPMVFVSSQDVHRLNDDEEDASGAFSDNVATVAGDPKFVAAAFAQFDQSDEDELSADLEQVSFFLDQSMPEEARASLQDLELRYPGHPRIAAKLREVQLFDDDDDDATQVGGHPMFASRPSDNSGLGAVPGDSVATSRIVNNPILGSTVIERPPLPTRETPIPRAVLGGGEGPDGSTHADLAIAYKGMGLFDAAIAELKLLTQDETQEVFALTMMGECFENKNSFTEAIIRYKRALNCEQVTQEETLLLYFLLGAAFERLGDISEALYFYEKVLKRQPKFRDVDLKVAELKPRLVKKGSVTAR